MLSHSILSKARVVLIFCFKFFPFCEIKEGIANSLRDPNVMILMPMEFCNSLNSLLIRF